MAAQGGTLPDALDAEVGVIEGYVNEANLKPLALACFMRARTPAPANVVSTAKSIPFASHWPRRSSARRPAVKATAGGSSGAIPLRSHRVEQILPAGKGEGTRERTLTTAIP